MLTIEKLEQILEEKLPLATQEDWDNSGWQVRLSGGQGIEKILLALEVNEAVAREAQEMGCQVILCHHPLLFPDIQRLDERSAEGRTLTALVRAGISVYACHTVFDKAEGGMNDYLGRILGFQEIRPCPEAAGEPAAYLRRGKLEKPLSLAGVSALVQERLGLVTGDVRVTGDPEQEIRTACWCTGSGGGFLRAAAGLSTDLYITGDVKYHDARWAMDNGLAVIDAGHFGTEQLFGAAMGEVLQDLPCQLIISAVDLNPFVW